MSNFKYDLHRNFFWNQSQCKSRDYCVYCFTIFAACICQRTYAIWYQFFTLLSHKLKPSSSGVNEVNTDQHHESRHVSSLVDMQTDASLKTNESNNKNNNNWCSNKQKRK